MKRTRLHTGEFRWSDDGYLEQRVFVVRHLDTDPEGVGTHYEWERVIVDGWPIRFPSRR